MGKNYSFSQYMKEVDRILEREVGIGHSDLPDFLWLDNWEDDVSPASAVETFIDDNGLKI